MFLRRLTRTRKRFFVARSYNTENKTNLQNKQSPTVLKKRTITLGGVYAAVPTPFKQNGDMDLEGLKGMVKRMNSSQLNGIVVLGSTGEFPLLSTEERINIMNEFVKCIDPKTQTKKLFAGVGTCSLKETIMLAKEAGRLGYHAVMVVTPYYYVNKMNSPKVLEEYFANIANSVDLPVILYNIPSACGVNIPVEVVSSLSKHPNIVGIKDSSGNVMQCVQYVQSTKGTNFEVLAGSGSLLLAYLMSGATGGILGVANVAPKHCVKLYESFMQGKFNEAREIQEALVSLNQAVTMGYGIPGLKVLLNHIGLQAGIPRSPLPALTDAETENILSIYKKCNIIDKTSDH
eukprot:TRINITY_DN6564_c0_g1_i1.p1 TRINITY_DN6564_c0_g1~~TRINITY_DN6564_c0_g1_i1.p1  ORF type:complete len:346 (+),score=44.21 TRINITY_DN6564_c0_g1_i1:58-1095(+)